MEDIMVKDNSKQRRSVNDRRGFSYTHHIPERRKGEDRREKIDHRIRKRKLPKLEEVSE
jgi:hypothetical protein